jgi:hypothetical protein
VRLAVDASSLVAEALRARGRKLLTHPELDLLVAAEAWNETYHELRQRVALLVERGHLAAAPAVELLNEALAAVAARITVVPRTSTPSGWRRPGGGSHVTLGTRRQWPWR